MLIHFVHTGDAYLPELQAYQVFIEAAGHQAQVHRHMDTLPDDAAVLWWMCGRVSVELAQRFPKAFHIHEYASASVPPLARLKDQVKRWRQAVPQYRIFQNAWVQQRMGFTDTVPCEFRDMGISGDFFAAPAGTGKAEFDFVYLGEMQRLQHFLPVFEGLAQAGRQVLLIGQIPQQLALQLQPYSNIACTGRVPHGQVPALLRRARFGLNLVPNQLPYTRQTSTKLLEYCAAGLPVVSTDYAWVRDFERQHSARFAYLPFHATAQGYRALVGAELEERQLLVPDVRALAWPSLLGGLQIWRQLGVTT
jgi:glycosyltransferase involved in cell wall biosynthesis